MTDLPHHSPWRLGPLALALGVFAALVGALLAAVLARTGTFVYTLDDPYIHLTLAREIAGGHYGLNPGEAAAPSSSVLWPFLLAPLARTGAAEALPLVLNVVFCACALVSLDGLLRRCLGEATAGLRLLLLGLAIPFLGLLVSVFNGMEHGLQIWLTVAGLAGLAEHASGRPVPRWAYAALVLGPFVRYENLALTIPALAYLFWTGERRGALVALALLTIGLGAFSAFLLSRGLGALPSSVLVKQAATSRGLLPGVATRLKDTVTNQRGVLLLAGAIALGGSALSRRRAERGLAAVGVATVALHVLAGAYVYRYVVYASATVVLILLVLHGPALAARWRARPTATGLLAAASVLLLMAPYVYLIATIPAASHNIAEQQVQMARFVRDEWRQPVAVNDLGLVSWHSPAYVVDLIGLGSYDVVRAHLADPTDRWIAPLVRAHETDLAMIYPDWFSYVPPEWARVGTLHISTANVTLGGDAVDFYATRPEAVAAITAALRRFRPTLPPGVALDLAADSLGSP